MSVSCSVSKDFAIQTKTLQEKLSGTLKMAAINKLLSV